MQCQQVERKVKYLSANLKDEYDVNGNLQKLESMELPSEVIEQFKLKELAQSYLSMKEYRVAAGRLLCKFRRAEKEAWERYQRSIALRSSPTSSESSRDSPSSSLSPEADDWMVRRKRTAPTMVRGLQRRSPDALARVEDRCSKESDKENKAAAEKKLESFLMRRREATAKLKEMAEASRTKTLSQLEVARQKRIENARRIKECGEEEQNEVKRQPKPKRRRFY
ncbi:unnamed protein product [Caenorhabditis sp. 36 PRJEB53466]|nr:unnamed protein product [Caenorhabditis sp. 36 PRJEB53466]